MKKILLTLVLTLTALNANAVETSNAAKYTFDKAHTNVIWFADHFGYSHPFGYFKDIDGYLLIDKDAPQNSKINVTIETDSLTTPVDKFTEHLKTDAFFDVKKFPEAKFVSTNVEVTGKDTANVTGNLTLHGVTKPLVLAVKLNAIGDNPMSKKPYVGFSANATIKRSDFGMTSYLPSAGIGTGVGDDVKLIIETEAMKVDADAATK